jgi:hypothetical protein
MHTSTASRIAAALLATPADYLARCLAQRCRGADACGSVFADYSDPAALLHALQSAAWEAYEHPAIMAGCAAFRAPMAGRVGIVALASLPADTTVVLADAKRTGYVEATVPGAATTPVDFAVIILGTDEGHEIVFTFHPGEPIAPSTLPASLLNGARMTAAVAIEHGLTHAKVVAA